MDKLYYNIWNIGFIESNIESIIQNNQTILKVKWLNHPYKDRFFADPFILSISSQHIEVLVEEFIFWQKKGFISKLLIDDNFNLIDKQIICEQNFHQSYPFILRQKENIQIIPEASQSGSLFSYQYYAKNHTLIEQKLLIKEPLLDSTFLLKDNYWWIFATKKGINSNKDLFIYYSNSINGNFVEHPLNPVKKDLASSRPAGNTVNIGNDIYRLAQVCSHSYGEAIRIYKVTKLDTSHFEETFIKELKLEDAIYNKGFHTLNGLADLSVVDGLKQSFSPLKKFYFEIKHLFNEK